MAVFELRAWELICYCSIFVVGLTGNLTVCLAVIKGGSRFRQVPFNVYLMSLAIADLILAVVCLPVYVMSTAEFPHPTGTRGNILCKIVTGYFLPFWLAGTSIYMLVIISYERYIAICKPFQAITRTTSKREALFIALAWCTGFLVESPTLIGVNFTEKELPSSYGSKCAFTWAHERTSRSIYPFVLIAYFVVPGIIFIVNFYRIRKCLTKTDKNLRRSLRDARDCAKALKTKRRTVRIVFVVSAAFFVCWTPNKVMYFLFQYAEMKIINWNSNVFQIGIILGFSNSCVNPFLYAFQSREFRSHCRNVFKKIFGKRHAERKRASSEESSSHSKFRFKSFHTF